MTNAGHADVSANPTEENEVMCARVVTRQKEVVFYRNEQNEKPQSHFRR